MFNKTYTNFVRPTSNEICASNSQNVLKRVPLSGNEAREIYLNEIKQIKDLDPAVVKCDKVNDTASHRAKRKKNVDISDKDLFLCVQNDDVDTLKQALDTCPDNINKLDDYGWSLLMIACQANSIESVKELLKRGVNTSVTDKAGNSAQSLVIKNKNYILADLLLSNESNSNKEVKMKNSKKRHRNDKVVNFFCEQCNIQTSNREHHLSSTVHNINVSKGKKLPTNYVIPESNRGFQIMLKVGWDKESGLGPDGSGKMYPIKPVQKQDRKGLGLRKQTIQVDTESVKHKNRKSVARDHETNRKIEINFRRQFY